MEESLSKAPKKNIVVLGSSGFIGSQICKALNNEGINVIKMPRTTSTSLTELKYALGKLLDTEVSIDGLVAAAWNSTHSPIYRESNENDFWANQTFGIAQTSIDLEIPFFGIGTCLEKLDQAPDPYTKAKNKVRSKLQFSFATSQWTWFRIHYVYSISTLRPSLLAAASAAMSRCEPFKVRNLDGLHDYIHEGAMSTAIVTSIKSDVKGIRDIGSGKLTSNRELLMKHFPTIELSEQGGKSLRVGYSGVADVKFLEAIGWCSGSNLPDWKEI